MIKKIGIAVLTLALLANGALAEDAKGVRIEVRVEGIQNTKGEVGVALFNQAAGYPTQLQNAFDIKWVSVADGPKAVDVTFEEVPLGEYAVSVIHDENVNGMLETGAYGFPEEGVGFSNNQKVVMGAPSFTASKFSISKPEPMKMTIQLDYRK